MITARILRGMTLTLREREFVKAARFMGAPSSLIIRKHILPNMASLMIIDVTITVGATILLETGLSYFGFGVQPPDVSLGTLIRDGSNSAVTTPWLFLFAGGLLVISVLAVNFIGDGLRDALDPNSRAGRPGGTDADGAEQRPQHDDVSNQDPVTLSDQDVLADPHLPEESAAPLLEVSDLEVSFPSEEGRVARGARAQLHGGARRGARHRRRVRVGQVGVLAGRDGPAAAVRRGSAARSGCRARNCSACPTPSCPGSAAGGSPWCSRTRCPR